MRVICIDAKDFQNKDFKGPSLKEGSEYTVMHDCPRWPDSYVLVECGADYSYWKKRFAPLSEIDETTFERNFKKELV